VFTLIDEKGLEILIDSFCVSFAKKNKLLNVPTYEQVLQHISHFTVSPDWKETNFLAAEQAIKIIPPYINQRSELISKDDYSSILINDGLVNNYFKVLEKSCPKAVLFCNQLIKVILLANLDSYIEGTSADGLGIAHIDFKKHYNENDFNELIIHQITHMLLFIDDYIEPQMDNLNKSIQITTLVKHKRGGNEFPLYILFHSFCVGVEVLQYRVISNTLTAPINYHAQTITAIKRCGECFHILNENSSLFTSKGKDILRDYGDIVDRLSTGALNAE
jgi:hypothetical protein